MTKQKNRDAGFAARSTRNADAIAYVSGAEGQEARSLSLKGLSAKYTHEASQMDREVAEYNAERDRQAEVLLRGVNEANSSVPEGMSEVFLSAPEGRVPLSKKAAYVVVDSQGLKNVLRVLKGLQRKQDDPVVARDAFSRQANFVPDEDGLIRIPVFASLTDKAFKSLQKAGAEIVTDGTEEIGGQKRRVLRANHIHTKSLDIADAARDLMAETDMSAEQAVRRFDTKRGNSVIASQGLRRVP